MTGPLYFIPDLDRHDPRGAAATVPAGCPPDVRVLGPQDLAIGDRRTLEGMASHAADRILSAPATPGLRVAGAGRGAVLALQLALELQGRDHAVAFAAAIDLPDALLPELPWAGDSLPVLAVQTTGAAGDAGDAAARQAAGWRRVLPDARRHVLRYPDLAIALAELQRHPAMAAPPAHNPLQTLQQSRQAEGTVFCCPGAGDSITRFIALAGQLGSGMTVQGLQPRGIDGLGLPHTTVQAAAQGMLRAMLAQRPRGPLHLIGHSFGGWIAFELAHLLARAGRPAASLTLVDSEAPGGDGRVGREYLHHEALERFCDLVDMAAPRPLGLQRAALRMARPDERLPMLHQAMVGAGMFSPRTQPAVLTGPFRTFCAALRTRYRPVDQPLPAATRVSLVCVGDSRLTPVQNAEINRATELGWRALAPQLVYWDGPGNHMTVLAAPQVQQLGAWWQRSITAAEPAVAGAGA